MERGIGIIMALCLLAGLHPAARAQEKQDRQGIPADVYYLMPAFGQGMVFFDNQAPAQGRLNICAADQTLRFMDKNGQELVASDIDHVVKVKIDTVVFLRDEGAFYRQYPLNEGMGVALLREVSIERDVKNGAFGTVSKTSAIQENKILYADGAVYNLESAKDYPYSVFETICVYQGDRVFSFSKKGLRKLFPDRKADIDAYFKAGNKQPDTVPEALELLSGWTSVE